MNRSLVLDHDSPAAALILSRPDLSESELARRLGVARARVRYLRESSGREVGLAALDRLAEAIEPGSRIEVRLVPGK